MRTVVPDIASPNPFGGAPITPQKSTSTHRSRINTEDDGQSTVSTLQGTESVLNLSKDLNRTLHLTPRTLQDPPPSFEPLMFNLSADNSKTPHLFKRKRSIEDMTPCRFGLFSGTPTAVNRDSHKSKVPRCASLFGSPIPVRRTLFRRDSLGSNGDESSSDEEDTFTTLPRMRTIALPNQGDDCDLAFTPLQTSVRKIKRVCSLSSTILEFSPVREKDEDDCNEQHSSNVSSPDSGDNDGGDDDLFSSIENGSDNEHVNSDDSEASRYESLEPSEENSTHNSPSYCDRTQECEEINHDDETACVSPEHSEDSEDDDTASVVVTTACPSPLAENQQGCHLLPCTPSPTDTIMRVEASTVRDLLAGKYSHIYDEQLVIDCRFPYEYEGGHIAGATNAPTIEALERMLLDKPATGKRMAVILHCEYSIQRAPSMASHLRRRDREANMHRYPYLYYPDIYVLKGGYRNFFTSHKNMCEPQNYVEMKDEAHTIDCRRRMMQFDRQFKRTKSMNDAGMAVRSISYSSATVSSSSALISNALSPTPALGGRISSTLPSRARRLTRTQSARPGINLLEFSQGKMQLGNRRINFNAL